MSYFVSDIFVIFIKKGNNKNDTTEKTLSTKKGNVNMKKTICLLLVCGMLFAACGTRDGNGTANDSDGMIENTDNSAEYDTTDELNEMDKDGENIVDDAADGVKDMANGASDAVDDMAQGAKNATDEMTSK